jgi:hypothetical protein
MSDGDRRQVDDGRSSNDRRSGIGTRSEAEKLAQGARRAGQDGGVRQEPCREAGRCRRYCGARHGHG